MPRGSQKSDTAQKKPRTYATGGGDATASGVNFQAHLGAITAVSLLTERPLDTRFGLGSARAIALRMETEAPLDDVLVETSDHGFVAMQAKNTLSRSRDLESEFGKTVEQIARQWRLCRGGSGRHGWDRPIDPLHDRLVIAVGPSSPATVKTNLRTALDARRQPGPPVLTQLEVDALADFDACLRAAWPATEVLTHEAIVEISKVTQVLVVDPEGPARSAWAVLLTPALQDPADGETAVGELEGICADLMAARGGVDEKTVRKAMLGRGVKLAAPPDYRKDVEALNARTLEVAGVLAAHEVVEAESGVAVGVTRRCQHAVARAAIEGHLLLIGEPGAGKSAVMNALGRDLQALGHDVVVLAVDQFSIQSIEGLDRQLGLDHGMVRTLAAWDGVGDAYLLIDALDASRGGPAEGAFKILIEQVIRTAPRWKVIASIRSFDLKLGTAFRAQFKGLAPEPDLADREIPGVRHIKIPIWQPEEFEELLAKSPKLDEILRAAPDKLRDLALVPFNTGLLADLVAAGAVGADFGEIGSQVALLKLYWNRRVTGLGYAGEAALRHIVKSMVDSRALRTPKHQLSGADPTAVQALVQAGVLTEIDAGQSLQFRHHLLFDYAASRLYLDAERIVRGDLSFPKSDGLGFVLAPATIFVLEALWHDHTDHHRFWEAVVRLLGSDETDPVIRSVVARAAVEFPVTASDLVGFADGITARQAVALAALPLVAGALAVRFEDAKDVATAPWVALAQALARVPDAALGVLRLLGFLLVPRVVETAERAELGVAMRALLRHAFTLEDTAFAATPAIGFVCETYATGPDEAKALLKQLFDPERFERFGFREVPMLARNLSPLAAADPDFAADVYGQIYANGVSDDRKTPMGTGRILAMTSTARQDYSMGYFLAGEFFSKFLEAYPLPATRGFLVAMHGFVLRAHASGARLAPIRTDGPEGPAGLLQDASHIWAHDVDPQYAEDGEVLLKKFVAFLRAVDEPTAVAIAQEVFSEVRPAIVWARLFMVAAVRGGALLTLVSPIAARPDFLISPDTRKDAIDVVVSDWQHWSSVRRAALENWALAHSFDDYTDPVRARTMFLQRLFGSIGETSLETDAARGIAGEIKSAQVANDRLYQMSFGRVAADDFRWMSTEEKAETGNANVISAIERAINDLHLNLSDTKPIDDLDAALASIEALKGVVDEGQADDDLLQRRGESTVAQATATLIATPGALAKASDPILRRLVELVTWAANRVDPIVEADTEAQYDGTWFPPQARVHAGQASLDLSLAAPQTYPDLSPVIDALLTDRHPAVRLQTALHLHRTSELDETGFWRRATVVTTEESNPHVIDFFLVNVLANLFLPIATDRVAQAALPLLERFKDDDPVGNGLPTHLAQMVGSLWLYHGHPEAQAWADRWAADPVAHAGAVVSLINWMGGALTAGLKGDDAPAATRLRAMNFIEQAVAKATSDFAELAALPTPTETELARARQASRIIDATCGQLLSVSGGLGEPTAGGPAALSPEGVRTFFAETRATLELVAEHASPSTIYHLLQLLGRLTPADPAASFDIIARALQRGGKAGGFELDFLSVDLVVKLFGEFLADHKALFDRPERRQTMMECLDIFVGAGWPSAQRLLYRLPELLR